MRIEVARTEPAFEGLAFGAVGPYEKVVGRLRGEVSPSHPLNAGIANLAHATVNSAGRVEYDCDFYLLKPVDLRRGNRRLLLDVPNRGHKVALHTLNDALRGSEGVMRIACNEPASAADAGNGFLMRHGYTILWCGWQGDALTGGEGLMAARLPVASDHGKPIVGMSREELVFEHLRSPIVAALSYPANSLDAQGCTLTVRQRDRAPRTVIPDTQWRFVSNLAIEIQRPAGFDASAIYEFIYPARDPIVMGLGLAALRDAVSFMRYASADELGAGNPLNLDGRPAVDHVLAYGMSQAGRLLRDFIHQGFNENLGGRKVLDGVMACMAGARKTFVNYPFAQPARHAREHEDRLFPHDQFPFSYAVTTDPVSGRTDGILARCEASGTCPKIMQTESSSDFFHGRASLLVTDGHGREIPVPECVRLYHFASVQHGGGGDPTLDFARAFPAAQHAFNPADFSAVHRALLLGLDRWVTDGLPPPPTQFPHPGNGTLIPATRATYAFPAIPGVTYPGIVNELTELDPQVQPPQPRAGRDYVVLVPAIDADGNELGGVRVLEIAVPRGTHTGWNPRREGHAAGGLSAIGAYFPFAASRAERAPHDARPSLAERYPAERDYARRVADAAADLCERGLLLPEDVERVSEKARSYR